ncbi:MAG: hypothetical protein JSS66_13785 [Armatimonadetes bacterium]|nr:hypothetical protein [Armatimonadota bacterium]
MRPHIVMTATIVFAALAALPVQQTLEPQFDIALGLAGLTTATARFDDGILPFYRQGDGSAMLFQTCYEHPWRTPYNLEMTRKQLALSVGKPTGLIEGASRALGTGTRRSLLGDPAKPYTDPANDAGALDAVLQKMKAAGVIKGAIPPTTSLPADVKRAAAAILQADLVLVDYRRAAFSKVGDLAAAYALFSGNPGEPDGPASESRQLDIQSKADMTYLYAAAQDLGAVVTWAEAACSAVPADKSYEFRLETEWGRIDLSGGGDSTHDGAATLLCIDTGGNDTYINTPCNASAANWSSVTIDTKGNDRYLSDPALAKTALSDWPQRNKGRGQSGCASALFGLTFLVDSQGDDLYRSSRNAFGSARFGVAYLGDYGGSDSYDAYADSEAFGQYGIGILDDASGSDKYFGFTQVQGAGLPHGLGLLIDGQGDDAYSANDQVLDFPSAQSAEHNNSMAQGAGYGFRADYLTGHSQSGGIGILYDLAGKDTYSCGVFGQGVGYWEGLGILWDDSGDDKYTGQWYVQGAAAHFGIGFLQDGDGNDEYRAPMNMAQGAGHDFSIGWLLDLGGADFHQAPNLSLGAGNANGIGVFVDTAGDDTYQTSGITLGSAAEAQKASLRERALCLGVFMDLGGQDTYPEGVTWAKNNSRTANWNLKNATPAESQVGVFLDR